MRAKKKNTDRIDRYRLLDNRLSHQLLLDGVLHHPEHLDGVDLETYYGKDAPVIAAWLKSFPKPRKKRAP